MRTRQPILVALALLGLVGQAVAGGTVITQPVGQQRITGVCAVGSAIRAVAANGSVTCESTSSISGLTTNAIAKATGATTIGNSLLTDDGSALRYNTSALSVTTGGNASIGGTLGVTGAATMSSSASVSGGLGVGVSSPTSIIATSSLFPSVAPKAEILTGSGAGAYNEAVVLRHNSSDGTAVTRRLGMLIKLSHEASLGESTKYVGMVGESTQGFSNTPSLHLVTADANRLTIDFDGNTTTHGRLSVGTGGIPSGYNITAIANEPDVELALANTAAGGRTWLLGSGATASGFPSSFYVYDVNAAAARLRIDSSGNVSTFANTTLGAGTANSTLVNGTARVVAGTTTTGVSIAGTALALEQADATANYLTFRGTAAKGLVWNNSTQQADGYLLYDQTARSVTIAAEGAIRATVGGADTSIANNLKLSSLQYGLIRPAAATGAVNDWAPAGLATATGIEITTTGQFDLTGISGGVDGRVLELCNSGPHVAWLYHDNASSTTAANRFDLPQQRAWPLEVRDCATVAYRAGTVNRWRLVSKTGTYFPGATFGADVTQTSGSFTTVGNMTVNSNMIAGDANTDTLTINARVNSHVYYTGATPTISACGTTVAIVGNDRRGVISTNAASCTLTFAAAWSTNPPVCVATPKIGTVGISAVSTTAITFTSSDTTSEQRIHYSCDGRL